MLPSDALGAATVAIAVPIEDEGIFLTAVSGVFVMFIVFDGLSVGVFAIVGVAIFTDAAKATLAMVDDPGDGQDGGGIFLIGLGWTGCDGFGILRGGSTFESFFFFLSVGLADSASFVIPFCKG